MTNEEFMKLFEKSKLNVSQFCRMCGIDRSTFYNYKNNKRKVDHLVGAKLVVLCEINRPSLWERFKSLFGGRK